MLPRQDSVASARPPRTRRAAPGRGRLRTISAVVLLLGALWLSQQLGHGAVPAPQGSPIATAPGPPAPAAIAPRAGPAVVYQRYPGATGPREILWRPLSSSTETVVLTKPEGGFGYLPSPDGKHLLVWETQVDPAHPVEDFPKWFTTRWFVQPLPAGPPTEVGQTAGFPLLLPFWQDNQHAELAGEVTLRGDRELSVFDLTRGRLSRPLPVVQQDQLDAFNFGVAHWVARTRLEAYAHQHMLPELAGLYRALSASIPDGGMGEPTPGIHEDLHGDLAEPPEYLLLRATGIPALSELIRHLDYYRPQFACAPDGSAIAYYWIYQHTKDSYLAAQYGADASGRALKEGVYARVDVQYFSPPKHRVVAVVPWPGALPLWPHSLIAISTDARIGVWPMCRDLRWSRDGRYLSFTEALDPRSDATVKVFDTVTWTEVLSVPHAQNAFVIPDAG